MNKANLLAELNKIIAEEMKPKWYWMCMFCGKHSGNGKWMENHIVNHCKDTVKEHSDEDYGGLLEGEWEEHTITVDPTLDGLRNGYRYLGFYPLKKLEA